MSYRLEKTDVGADIVIEGFEDGIADSPYEGISDMRNINTVPIPKEASVNFKTQPTTQTPVSAVAFTVLASNDTFTYTGTQLKVGTTIVLNTLSGGTGLALATNYWVKSATATTFTVSATVSGLGVPGSLLNVTLDGSGTFSTVNISLITQMASYVNGITYVYGVDTNTRVWVYLSSATDTNWVYLGNTVAVTTPPVFLTGLTVWCGYIILLYRGPMDIGLHTCPASTAAASFTFFKAVTGGGVNLRAFIDKSNQLYWCDGNEIGSLIQLTTFDPTSSATYTFSKIALAIQATDSALCIEQLGTNLLIGGLRNHIYSWNRSSTGYNLIFIPESYTYRIVAVNSNAFFFSGTRGRIFVTNGANAQLYKKIPDHLSGTTEPAFIWGGAAFIKNQLVFSLSCFSSTSISSFVGTGIPNYCGIWALDTDTLALRLVNQFSYATYAGYAPEIFSVQVTYLSTSGITGITNGLMCSWEDSTETASPNYGVDATSFAASPAISNVPYSNYEAYVDSDMIPIGTYLNPQTNANVEFKITVPMVTGEGLKFGYRQNLSQSFTPITSTSRPTGEFTSADGIANVIQVNFQKSQWIQIRTYTKSTSSSPSYVRLYQVRIR